MIPRTIKLYDRVMIKLFLLLFVFASLGAILSGLLGVGGGIVFVPLLDFFYGQFDLQVNEIPRYILANSITATLIASTTSAIKHYKNGARVYRKSLKIASTAIFSSLLVTYSITQMDWYQIKDFKMIFLSLLLLVAIKMLLPIKEKVMSQSNQKYFFVGLLTGVVAALSGLGGGVIMVPLLTFYCGEKLKKSSQISITAIAFFMLPNALYYLLSIPELPLSNHLGYVNIFAQVIIFCAVFIFSPLGIRLANNLSNRLIQSIFATLLLLIVIRYVVQIFY